MIEFHDNVDYYIDGYIRGTLSETEKEAFEEHFFECDECFRELSIRGALKTYLDTSLDKGYLRELLGSIGETQGDRQEKKQSGNIIKPKWHRSSKKKLLVAATIFVVIAAPLIYSVHLRIRGPNNITNQSVESTGYQNLLAIAPPVYIGSNRAPASDNEATFNRAMNLFAQKKYAEAASLLDRIKEDKKLKPKVDFYLGVSYYFLDKTDDAVALLKTALNEKPSEIRAWYLAHALLKKGKLSEAMEMFNRTASYKGKYEREAQTKADALSKLIKK